MDLSATAWKGTRANQQLVEQQRRDAARAPHEQAEYARLTALGRRVRDAFAGFPLPLTAVQTHFSLLEGTASPQAWAIALGAFADQPLPPPPDRRGANHPAGAAAVAQATALIRAAPQSATSAAPPSPAREPPSRGPLWAALADRGDVAGLPAAIGAWGRGRVAAGATVPFAGGDAVLLAATAAGWSALCRLLSARHAGRREERLFDGGAAGIVALVRDAALGRRLAAAGAEVLWRAGLRPETDDAPFPVAAVPLLTHLDGDRVLAPVLRAVRERSTVDPRTAPGAALADLAGMPAAYRGYEDQLARGAALRQREWLLPEGPSQKVLHLPPLPPDLVGADPDAELRRRAEAGIPGRYGAEPPPGMRPRIEHELAVIRAKEFASYLLTVDWIVREQKGRTCGRGSAASSIIVYLLGITNVDPLRWNLLFDRFLSPEREDPPDVDVDFAWDERDEVFSRILQGFGAERVGVVATHQCMSRDGAFREAARAHGLGDGQITAMAGRLHDLQRYGVDRDGRHDGDLPEPWPAVIGLAHGLHDAPRHLGVHCGGVVITRGPLSDLVPVHPAAKRVPVVPGSPDTRPMPAIAWEKDGAEDLGLVKIDVLGNRSLAVVRDCRKDLEDTGVRMPIGDAILDDARTKELLANGDTIGCFYVESPAMRQLQAKVNDGGFDRLVVHSSIIRPAGMAFIRMYIDRHKALTGPNPPSEEVIAEWYPHPSLRGLLSESYGVLSYQEDVMVVAQKLAGFTPGQANHLRKALGRDDTAKRLEGLIESFREGCRTNGVDEETIKRVWEMISSFAGYSFAKAHSASYAAVSMECVWLKAHHPAVFFARVIANEGGFYRRSAYVEAARRRAIAILAPCVAVGAWPTRGRGMEIRLGFHCIGGLSRATADAIVAQRPFAGVRDLVRRSGCSSDEAHALLEAGALDALMPGRDAAQRAWTVAAACNDRGPSARGSGQETIDLDAGDRGDVRAPRLPAIDRRALLIARHARLGALPEDHPLRLYDLPGRPAVRVVDLLVRKPNQWMSLVAIAIARKDVNAIYEEEDGQRVEDMAFVSFEDETGVMETVWFPDVYRRNAVLLERGEPLLLTGIVQEEHGVKTLSVRGARAVAR